MHLPHPCPTRRSSDLLGDYSRSKAYFDALDGIRTVRALVDVVGREPPKFQPGTQWAYSNTGFVILGRVIEIVTDRKSTRLNSSHLVKSYAVFCVQKKV